MKKLIILLLILSIALVAFAQNPFTKQNTKIERIEKKSAVWIKIVEIQKKLNRSLSQNLRTMKNEFNPKTFFLLLGISFLYGVIHALGPGHGKMLISAYFIQEKASIISSFKIGSVLSLTHSGSAAILGVIIGIFFQSAKMYKDNIQLYIGIISGSLIVILGVVYLFVSLFKKSHVHSAFHNKNEILIGIFSGIVPCPVSMTIILFSIFLDMLWLGLVCVLALSVGIAITISMIGVLTIKTRGFTEKLTGAKSKQTQIMAKILSVLGSVIIIVIGATMIISNL